MEETLRVPQGDNFFLCHPELVESRVRRSRVRRDATRRHPVANAVLRKSLPVPDYVEQGSK